MKERPAYKDYTRQILILIFNIKPALSGERRYSFSDRWLLLLGQLPIIISMIFIYNYSPFSIYPADLPKIVAVIICILILAAYWLFFTYNFARFRVMWADPDAHPDENASLKQDELGYFHEIKEDRVTIRKSLGWLVAFTAAIAVLAFLCCYIMYGLAPSRLYYNHKQDLERLITHTNDYDYINILTRYPSEDGMFVGIDDPTSVDKKLPTESADQIKSFVRNLNCNYLLAIGKEGKDSPLYFILSARYGLGCDIIWYPQKVSSEEVKRGNTHAISTTQLDEHWWLIWNSGN